VILLNLHRDGRIEGLTDLRDESDRNGMRIILETTRNVEPEDVLADLFRLTPMQSTFSISILALVDGEPRVLTLKQALRVYIDHRLEIVRRRSEYDLERAKQRAHILEGLLTALDNLDEVIDTIRRSRTTDTAKINLQKKFKLTDVQAQAILDMPLRRLAAMERRKIQEEHTEKVKQIKYFERLLSQPKMMRDVVKEELLAVREKYNDVRRTQIVDAGESKVLSATDLLPDEKVWVLVGEKGTLARTTSPELVDIPLKPAELPLALLEANTQDNLYLFAADGRAASLPVYQLPQSREMGVGKSWAELSGFSRRDHLAAAAVIPPKAEGYLFLTTLAGVVKRVRLEDLPGLTTEPFTVINVSDDDSLGWVAVTSGEDEVLLSTAAGRTIRFKESDVRPMGLPAGGVLGVKLLDDADGLVGMDVVDPDGYLWSVTDDGLAKATSLSEYPTKGRYGQGVINVRLPKGSEEVVATVVGREKTQLVIKTALGSVKKLLLGKSYIGSRAVKPKQVVKVGQRNRVVGAIRATDRLQMDDEGETAVPEQLTLLTTNPDTSKKVSGKTKSQKNKKK
jgi:DNA gyrase subunit A